MADSVTVLYAVNGTTKKMKVTGPHITVQVFSGGCVVVAVHTEDGGRELRSLYFTEAYIIDRHTEDPNPEAIR